MNFGLTSRCVTSVSFSAEKKIYKNLFIYAKATNLTNTPYVLQLHQSYVTYLAAPGSRALPLQTDINNRITVQKDNFKTNYLFGVRYKF